MNQLCEMKGIKREFSVARTLQQNGVAKRKNRTLIKAARTMLADSLLPTTFWAEVINTTCYVQNRVLVTKPHNKTPYELLIGKTSNLDFMRPFGCPVTILNTLDHLCKFERKDDEGFLVGYSVNSKAFRVFNTRTKKVEENLHIKFLENKSNIAGSGPEWLFDINSLTKSMNYEPVSAGNQTNGDADDKNVDEEPAKGDDGVNKVGGSDDKERTNSSTQDINTARPSINTANTNINTGSLNINTVSPNMPSLEETGIFDGAYDDEDVGAEADLNSLETTMNVSPIPTTRIHKDHPKDQIIRDLNLAAQTRRMINFYEENVMNEPKKLIQALADPSWIESMQEELLQFKLQKVWTLVDLPNSKRAIGTIWVFRNKKDKRGIVFAPVAKIEAIKLFLAYVSFMGFIVYQMDRKSAFLYDTIEEEVYVCQPLGFKDPHQALYGLHQAPRAWYETLSTYLLENRFRRGTIDKTLFIKKDKCDILLVQVYVDDIIFGSIKKSLGTEFEQMMHKRFQMSSMKELTFFLGFQVQQKEDGIFISQDKYVADILKKFSFITVKIANTPMEPNKALIKDEEAEDVDVHIYRSMIGSLIYLTASRPYIMFVVCAYARDSPFDLEAFFYSDYAGASLDKKSITEGCQFLSKRLISWQCKKQTIVVNSTTEAEYVAVTNCCGQVLWI
ncbi:putative ribonuclease H-like domain-containing protein [Tanacetum coccineum]